MKQCLWLAIVAAIGTYICGPLIDPDLWWHVTVGRWIIANAQVPDVDYWNMFGAGKPWMAYSWTNELILGLVEKQAGLHGLLALKIVLSVLLAGSFFYVFGWIARDYFFGGLLGVIGTAACFNHFTLRPQSFVWVLFVWLLFLIVKIERDGLNTGRGIALALLMMLWANTHLTAGLGLFTAGVWLFFSERRGAAIEAVGWCFLGTLLTPYLGGEWATFLLKAGHPVSFASISEFQPATILQYSTGFLVVLGSCLLMFLHFSPKMLALGKVLLCCAFLLGALAVVKFMPFAAIILCGALAEYWLKSYGRREELGEFPGAIEKLREGFQWLPREGFTFLTLCVVLFNIYKIWSPPVSALHIPYPAVDFIEQERLPQPILNEFGRGGYLMYRFSDSSGFLKERVPIDGRTNVNPPEIWELYMASSGGKVTWRGFLEAVEPRTILWRRESPFLSLLLESREWCLVFQYGGEYEGHVVLVHREVFNGRAGELISENCSWPES